IFGEQQKFKGQWWLMHNLLIPFGGKNDFKDINRNVCTKLLKKQNFDVFHPTFFDSYFLPYLDKKPFVLTIHDMIPELYPQYFQQDDFQIIGKQILAPKASAIIAVSETTKKDVVRILNVPEEKVFVIHHGCSMSPLTDNQRYFDDPYILYVGERFGYKNFSQFVTAAVTTLKRHEDLNIVCTGRPFSLAEKTLFSTLGISDRMHHFWADTDSQLYSLYHNAECFVYPSEYEGFGIPILEAYTADCPVLLNDASCFPEI
ncbi:MAG: glycosyltransferase family 1 protein, partial [Bacillota bacterium]|nr:glycosyltransferase family 1 protein [Bacillota bacterium]